MRAVGVWSQVESSSRSRIGHGLVDGEVEAEPGDAELVLREVLDLPDVPVRQLPLGHDLEHVPDRAASR